MDYFTRTQTGFLDLRSFLFNLNGKPEIMGYTFLLRATYVGTEAGQRSGFCKCFSPDSIKSSVGLIKSPDKHRRAIFIQSLSSRFLKYILLGRASRTSEWLYVILMQHALTAESEAFGVRLLSSFGRLRSKDQRKQQSLHGEQFSRDHHLAYFAWWA